jgi:hypothetical protein
LLKNKKVVDVGPKMKNFIEKLGFTIVKYDENNEMTGTLIIGVNKTIREFIKKKKPPGHLHDMFTELFSLFSIDEVSLSDIDEESQRIGLELYLWPTKKGVILEMFILPLYETLKQKRNIWYNRNNRGRDNRLVFM